jgi:undecaprenyl-diphosphatase
MGGAALIGGALFVALAIVAHGRGGLGIDESIVRSVVRHRPALLVDSARIVTRAGSAAELSLVAVSVAVVGLLVHRGPARSLAPAVALGMSSLLSQATKAIVDRTRPPLVWHLVNAPGHSFPSGHATNVTAVLLTGALVLPRGATRSPRRLGWLVGAALIIGAVGASRVVLGVHWPTDVLAGWILGAEVAGATALAMVRVGGAKRSKPVGG